jgi:hypothetical protein
VGPEVEAHWFSVVAELAGIAATAFIAAISATWIVGSKMATRKEVADLDKRLVAALDKGMHDYGESLAAIRQKIEQVELWVRDNFIPKDDIRESLSRLNAEVDDLGDRLEPLPGVLVKVDTLWSFVIDRGRLEARDKGYMEKNSPLILTEAGIKAVEPIMPVIVEFCQTHPGIGEMEEDELASTLVKYFEQKLLDEVCEPSHIYLGACIVMLIEALKMRNIVRLRPRPGSGSTIAAA